MKSTSKKGKTSTVSWSPAWSPHATLSARVSLSAQPPAHLSLCLSAFLPLFSRGSFQYFHYTPFFLSPFILPSRLSPPRLSLIRTRTFALSFAPWTPHINLSALHLHGGVLLSQWSLMMPQAPLITSVFLS